MPDIDQEKDRLQTLGGVKIVLDHFPPLCLHFLGRLGIAVPRKIHQIHGVIDVVEIDRLRLARLCGGTRQRFPVHQRIDQR